MARSSAQPAGRHRGGRRRGLARIGTRPIVAVISGAAVLGVAAAITLVALQNGSTATGAPVAHGGVSRAQTSTSPAAVAPATAPPTTSSPTSSPTASATLQRLTSLVAQRSASSTSVAALDTVTGARAIAGAKSGMTTASAVKVELLESLLLEHQRAGTELSGSEVTEVTAMIEHSDNDAAEDVFWAVGGHDAVEDLEHALGLSTKTTALGDDDYWGLTTTSAAQQLVLLGNLVDTDSPLDAKSRTYALQLMRNVEADQTWGVPVVATSGHPAVKNGWLGVDSDGGLWAVNSLGVVTVDGHTVLIAVMTQHNQSYASGVRRVESLARAAASAVVHP